METDDLTLFYQYNRWANARVLDACRALPTQQLTAPAAVSFGSVLGNLAHVFSAEANWRRRLQLGISPNRMLTAEDFSSLEDLAIQWQSEEKAMQAYIESLEPEKLNQWVEYHTNSGALQGSTLWRALMHVVFHGVQFRGEAGAALSVFQHSPGDLDFNKFLRETNQR